MKWIQIDIDPLKSRFPDVGLCHGHARAGRQQHRSCNRCWTRSKRAPMTLIRKRVAARIESWSAAREASAKRRAAASANKGVSGALNPAFVAGDA